MTNLNLGFLFLLKHPEIKPGLTAWWFVRTLDHYMTGLQDISINRVTIVTPINNTSQRLGHSNLTVCLKAPAHVRKYGRVNTFFNTFF